MNSDPVYQALDFAVLRMPVFQARNELPILDGVAVEDATEAQLRQFLNAVASHSVLYEAISLASPPLSELLGRVARGEQLRQKHLRKAAVSAIRYVIRAGTRSTPFGLFAGVAPVTFGERTSVHVGSEHVKHCRLDGIWLDGLLKTLEQQPEVLRVLDVVINDTCLPKGNGLHIPLQAVRGGRSGSLTPGRVVVRSQPLVQTAVTAARRPIGFIELCDRLLEAFPSVSAQRVEQAMVRLVRSGVLLTSLRPPLDADPMDYMLRQLANVPELGIVESLKASFADYRHTSVGQGYSALLTAAATAGRADTSRMVQVDLRCDAHVVLPHAVAEEGARAADLLTRIAQSEGLQSEVLRDFRFQFVERYGRAALVPLNELLDPERGLGIPDWQSPGSAGANGQTLNTFEALQARVAALAELAWPSGSYTSEVELTSELVDRLTLPSAAAFKPTGEIVCELLAADVEAIERGNFRLVVRGGSHQVGTLVGRFGHVLPETTEALRGVVSVGTPEGAMPAQLFFQASDGLAYSVACTPRLVERVISFGEFRPNSGADVMHAEDLAVGVHEDGLYLASALTGQEIHFVHLSALIPETAKTAHVRFLREVALDSGRGLAEWSWGPLAMSPRLPRVSYGRSVIIPERWRPSHAMQVDAGDWQRWKASLDGWRQACEVPRHVQVRSRGVNPLALDLDRPAHQRLLWDELRRRPDSFVEESFALVDGAVGWLNGHCSELVIPVRSSGASVDRPASKPRPVAVPVVHSLAGEWLYARIEASSYLHDEILAEHLPSLISALGDAVDRWFFIRYDYPSAHLRLRLHGAAERLVSIAAPLLSDWAKKLANLGLAGTCELHPYRPEISRYGGGDALREAEAVFQADSEVVLTQLALSRTQELTLDRQFMAALNFVAIVRGVLPQDWPKWLLGAVPSDFFREAYRTRREEFMGFTESLVDVAVRCGGDSLAGAWLRRDRALARYAKILVTQSSNSANGDPFAGVLHSLMHMHHIRSIGIDRASEGATYALARGIAELTLASPRLAELTPSARPPFFVAESTRRGKRGLGSR